MTGSGSPRPESVFEPWDGRSVMLFDSETQTATAPESAIELIFSPAGTKALMLRGRRIDLDAGDRTATGSDPGDANYFAGYHIVGSAASEDAPERRPTQTWTVIREKDGATILSVEAVLALPAGLDSIVILADFRKPALANMFTIDLADGLVTAAEYTHAVSTMLACWTRMACRIRRPGSIPTSISGSTR